MAKELGRDFQNQSLLKIAIPVFFEVLLLNVVNNIDIYMLSNYNDKAVGALGGIKNFLDIQNILLSFLCIGATILISQYIGASKYHKIKEVAQVSLLLTSFLALLIGGIYAFNSTFIFNSVNLSGDYQEIVKLYFILVGGLCVFQGISLCIGAILRAHGYTKEIFFINVVVNLINIIGNATFIYGLFEVPVLGVTGVGISTVLARGIGAIIFIAILIKKCGIHPSFKIIFDLPIGLIRSLILISSPAILSNMSYGVAQTIIQSFINGMSDDIVTTKTYLYMLVALIVTVPVALGQGTAILVGRQVGASDYDAANKECMKNVRLAFLITIFTSGAIAIFGPNILRFFTDKKEILDLARPIFILFIFLETGRTFNIVIINALNSSGDLKYPAIVAVTSMFSVAVLLSYLLGVRMDYALIGIWIANGSDEWLRGILLYRRWKSGKWKEYSLIK